MGEGVPSIAGLGELREVGRGGFGVVYDGFQFEFGRRVAVKVLNRRLVDDGSVASFELECRSMGALSKHPYIVTVLASAFTSDHRPCIVMELFEHGNYLTKIARDGPLSVQELLSLGVCMAGAVETAHRQGVVHGDVKPQNIFLSEFGYPALGDFGVAALQGLWSGGGLSLSVDYAAPELIGEDTTVLGPLSDQYSLGATLYTLATGRRPFETVSHESPHQTLMRVRSEPGPRLPDSFPEPLVTAVGTAMAHNPQHRYPDLATFAASLSHIERQLGYPPTKIPLPATSQNTPTGLTTPTTPDPTTPESPTIIRPTRSANPHRSDHTRIPNHHPSHSKRNPHRSDHTRIPNHHPSHSKRNPHRSDHTRIPNHHPSHSKRNPHRSDHTRIPNHHPSDNRTHATSTRRPTKTTPT